MKSKLLKFKSLAIIIAVSFLISMPAVIYGAFYSCTDKEGNEILSDHPKQGFTCRQIGGFEEEKSTREGRPAKKDIQESADERTTKITVQGNRVVVPATIIYKGNEAEVKFVMDTGAEATTVSADVADQLYINLYKAPKAKARVVGGGIIDVSVVKIDALMIGPHTIRDYHIAVVPQEGDAVSYDGLLGMDVLGKFSFHVDMKNQVIIWK